MLKAYKFRLDPTVNQKALLDKHFSCARFIYNLALETKKTAYSGTQHMLSKYDLQNQLPALRKEFAWLKEVSAVSLQNSVYNVDTAFNNFYKGRSDFPKFKRKKSGGSFHCTSGIKLKTGVLIVAKFLEGIKVIQHRYFEGEIKRVTISKTPTGKYFASILVKDDKVLPEKIQTGTANSIGIDLGIKTFAVLSDGKQFESPKLLRLMLPRLKVLQRRASRKKKGSANKKKAIKKVALLHEYISNQREDFLHKISNQITNNYDTICVEDLNIQGMIKNHNLALSISDASWSDFVRQLNYKSDWRGKNLIQIGRFEPTTKKCSVCGKVKLMPLSERNYNCECGLSIDRDINAAINIRNSGIGCAVVSVELPTIVGAMKQKLTINV